LSIFCPRYAKMSLNFARFLFVAALWNFVDLLVDAAETGMLINMFLFILLLLCI